MNGRIHKSEAQESRWSDEYWQIAANFIEYHIVLPKNHHSKIHNVRQLFHVTNVC